MDFVVEAGEADAECLEQTEWVRHIHIEGLLAIPTELQVDHVLVEVIRQLEILLARLCHAPVKVLLIIVILRQKVHDVGFLWRLEARRTGHTRFLLVVSFV